MTEPERRAFVLGFERGLVQGRSDSLCAALERLGKEGRLLAKRVARLAARDGFEAPRALAIIFDTAWAMTHPRRSRLERLNANLEALVAELRRLAEREGGQAPAGEGTDPSG